MMLQLASERKISFGDWNVDGEASIIHPKPGFPGFSRGDFSKLFKNPFKKEHVVSSDMHISLLLTRFFVDTSDVKQFAYVH
jgi:hypothetical protein